MQHSRIPLSVVIGSSIILMAAGCSDTDTSSTIQPGAIRASMLDASNLTAGVGGSGVVSHEMLQFAGEAAGPGGGWLIAASRDHIKWRDLASAERANQLAEQKPATREAVALSDNADLNHDGFVTLDEVCAMQRAGLNDEQMLERFRKTDVIFELSDRQKQYLRDRGVSEQVISYLDTIEPKAI